MLIVELLESAENPEVFRCPTVLFPDVKFEIRIPVASAREKLKAGGVVFVNPAAKRLVAVVPILKTLGPAVFWTPARHLKASLDCVDLTKTAIDADPAAMEEDGINPESKYPLVPSPCTYPAA